MNTYPSLRPVHAAITAASLLFAVLCATGAPASQSSKTPPPPATAAVAQAAPAPPIAADSTASVTPESVMFVPTPQAGDEFELDCLADVGVDPADFMRAIAPLYDGSMIEMHSLLVLARGALIYEDYFVGNTDWIDFDHGLARVSGEPRPWLPADLHYVASIAKSVTSLVAGIAFAELGWSLEDPLAPRLRSEPWLLAGEKAGITARHILTMTSGVRWNEWNGTSESDARAAPERFKHFASLPMEALPGERWTYNSIAPTILLLALDRAVEHGIREFADERLFTPLGINNYRWAPFEGDIPDGGARLFLRPRDMAKIGLLILNRGSWRGTQVVPRDYMIAATSPQVSTTPAAEHHYGYLTWIRELSIEDGAPVRYIAVEGDGGNQINIFPDRDLIVVTTGGNYGEFPVYEPQAQHLLQRIVPLFPPRKEEPQPLDAATTGF